MIHTSPAWRGARRKLGVAFVAVVSTAAIPNAFRTPGITYDSTTTYNTQSPMAGGIPAMNIVGHGMSTADGSYRMDIISADNAMGTYAVGDYFLTVGGRPIIVHPATKTYVDMMDLSSGMLSKMPPEMLSQLQVSKVDGKIEKVAGDSLIEGRRTTHYRSTMTYSIAMMGQELPTTITSDYWLAKLPLRIANPMAGTKTAPVPGTPEANSPMAAITKKAAELVPPMTEGTPVLVVMSTSVNAQGMSILTTMTTSITNIKQGDIDATLLALPAGFQKSDK